MKLNLISILLFLACASCKEQNTSDVNSERIEVTLQGTELYQYKIANAIPTEGGYEIRKQAENYKISEMNWGTYNFQAKEGFSGFETIEIVLITSTGDNNFTDQQKWIFEIEVQ